MAGLAVFFTGLAAAFALAFGAGLETFFALARALATTLGATLALTGLAAFEGFATFLTAAFAGAFAVALAAALTVLATTLATDLVAAFAAGFATGFFALPVLFVYWCCSLSCCWRPVLSVPALGGFQEVTAGDVRERCGGL